MWVYLQGWGSGWRAFALESASHLREACQQVGVDVAEFEAYVADDGPATQALGDIMSSAESHGSVGVPHYVFNDAVKGRQVGLFGREHLALIRAKYLAAGLARRPDVTADFSHTWGGPN